MNILANIMGLAGGQGLLILFVIILLFGAKRLPELARGLGQSMREFSKGKEGLDEEEKKKLGNSPENKA